MRVHEARSDALPAAMTVFDSAMLQTDAGAVEAAIDGADLLVATSEGRVLGACLLDGHEIEAIAVRPGRRGQGIGTALVAAAADRRGRLVAEFDPRVRPFWDALGFEIEVVADGRLRGVRSVE
ncbi:GNAT family N-acetyltransferase [Halorientalis litorea]|uniref:GNAT family N-acetyltransferase n=1 Tax=Halorientalis litorea TaxID=2931977 RepID=UPI001FF273FC|nr:GNAT family N-acetyltransferase [Halorientalis litorea]